MPADGVDSHEHEHHGHGETSSRRKLAGVTLINMVGFAVELAGGLAFGSIALIGDAVHMLFDSLSYLSAFLAAYAAEKVQGGEEWTFGFHRLEVFTAIFNGLLLIPMAGYILWEAYQRYLAPVTIDIVPAVAVALGGLAVNLGSVVYLHGQGRMSLNEKGAYFHLLGDTAGSIAVIIGLLTVQFTGVTVVDPLVAALIAVMVLLSAASVLREGAGILLQKSPIRPSELKAAVEEIDGVEDAHDIKSWQVCSKVNVCTVHATMSVTTLEEAEKIRERIDRTLKDRFNLQHVTLQIEQAGADDQVDRDRED